MDAYVVDKGLGRSRMSSLVEIVIAPHKTMAIAPHKTHAKRNKSTICVCGGEDGKTGRQIIASGIARDFTPLRRRPSVGCPTMVPSTSRTESLRRRGDSTHVALGPRWREQKGQYLVALDKIVCNDRMSERNADSF